jgi:uncharacterized protein YggE
MRAKAILLVSVALVAVFALSSWAKAQSASGQPASGQPRLITVTGDADVRVVPDEVILTLGVETWDKNMDIAKRQNDEIVTKVLALATDHGIAPEHIQTDYISIEPRYRNDGYYEQRDFIGFFVHKTVVLTLRDLSSFEAVLSGALNAGVNYVHGIEFRTTELRKHRDEARALAIQAAQEKATALAGELGQKVGNPITIQEEQSGWWSGYNAWWGSRYGGGMAQNVIQEAGGAASLADGSVAPGQIRVNSQVTVSFELTL